MRSNMKAERARNQLRLSDVAKKLGVSTNAVWRWEQGVAAPSANHLVQLVKLYGVSPDYLMDDQFHGKTNTHKNVFDVIKKPSVDAEGDED